MKQQTSIILRRCLRKEMEKAASAAEYYPNWHIQIEQARRQGVRPDLIAAHEWNCQEKCSLKTHKF